MDREKGKLFFFENFQLVFKNEDENEKFSRSKKFQSPTYTAAMELLRSVSKWEIVGCGA
jgi:hypothetical protein